MNFREAYLKSIFKNLLFIINIDGKLLISDIHSESK